VEMWRPTSVFMLPAKRGDLFATIDVLTDF
jgi:hypothetical protein